MPQIFPDQPDEKFDRSRAACQVLGGACPEPGANAWSSPPVCCQRDPREALQAHDCGHRLLIYSNGTLFDLLMCLADRVDECCGLTPVTLLLRYVAGDAQTAPAGSILPSQVVVQVVDNNGQAVGNEAVTFRVRGGGGSVLDTANTPQSDITVVSSASGMAKATWQIGPNAGLNTLEASIASGAQVVFSALGQAEVTHPPVITKFEPSLGDELNDESLKILFENGIIFAFDREMHAQDLDTPEKWLALWFVGPKDPAAPTGQSPAIAMRAELHLADPNPAAPSAFARYKFSLEMGMDDLRDRGFRGLLAAHAAGNNIRGDTDGVLLDADFAGTLLEFQKIGLYFEDPNLPLGEALFNLAPHHIEQFDPALYNGLQTSVPPALPSGDGTPGGIFSSWFSIR